MRKLRYESWQKSKLYVEPYVGIMPDKVNKTLSITDTGIGMTKTDLDNIGEGFYSAFLVAEKVIITTKHDDDEPYIWESQAGGSFTITRDTEGRQLDRGTEVTLFLKEDQLEYLEERKIKDLVKEMSSSFAIYLWTEKEISDDEDDEPKEEEGAVAEVDEEKEDKKGKKRKVSHEWEHINKHPWFDYEPGVGDDEPLPCSPC